MVKEISLPAGTLCMVRYSVRDERPYRISDLSTIRNISEDGFLFTSTEPFPHSTVLELELKLPLSAEPVRILGKLVWNQELRPNTLCKNGVEFIRLNEEDRRRIVAFVGYILKRGKVHYRTERKPYQGQERRKFLRVDARGKI